MLLAPIEMFKKLLAEFDFERETNTGPIISPSFDGDLEQIIKQQ